MNRWVEGSGLDLAQLERLARFGWAPGGYTVVCVECTPKGFHPLNFEKMGAKRCTRCEECAEKAADAFDKQPPLKEYAFDVKLFATMKVKARTEKEARELYERAVTNYNFGNEGVVVSGLSLDEPANDELISIDGVDQ